MQRRRGFTLIELLVVIAIIGILAAMLFPVFARARESARKVQCLSNIKNIALAVQMYLSDYDKFPPHEMRSDIWAWFTANPTPGGHTPTTCNWAFPNGRIDGINPYLKWPVVLDEYIKNRDVWRCPSARSEQGPGTILGEHWFEEMVARVGEWGVNTNLPIVCDEKTFPPGWGGTVTDSLVQDLMASDGGGPTAFKQSIGTGEDLVRGVSASQIGDASSLVICADSLAPNYWSPSVVIFPDSCQTQCGSTDSGCCNSGDDASAGNTPAAIKHSLWQGGPEQSARTRHLGGSNLGFADGHAKWWPAMAIANAVKNGENTGTWGCPYGRTCLGLPPPPTPTLYFDVNGGTDVWTGCLCKYHS